MGCDGQEVAAITFISRYFFCLGNAFFAVGDRQGDLENTFVLPNYFRTDAAIFYNRDRFKASLNFNNLFDAGITGSILVFWHEIDKAVIAARFGRVIPGDTKVSLEAIANTVKTAYASKGFNLSDLDIPSSSNHPYMLSLMNSAEKYWQVFVNPDTGQIMGDRSGDTNWGGIILNLHYALFAGNIGTILMGIVALLTVILSITGIILWPGWRKLAAGFKIKWNAHIKRRNFDLHKVAGIITAIFLAAIGFTSFAWNIPQARVADGIYAVTFTPKPAEAVSQVIPGKSPLSLDELVQRADTAFPNAKSTYVSVGSTRFYLDKLRKII